MWNDKTGICVTSRIIIGLVISNLESINDIASNPIAALSRKDIVISRVPCLDTSSGLKSICNARLNFVLDFDWRDSNHGPLEPMTFHRGLCYKR